MEVMVVVHYVSLFNKIIELIIDFVLADAVCCRKLRIKIKMLMKIE
jgi:hypothetical protein